MSNDKRVMYPVLQYQRSNRNARVGNAGGKRSIDPKISPEDHHDRRVRDCECTTYKLENKTKYCICTNLTFESKSIEEAFLQNENQPESKLYGKKCV